MNVSDPNLPLLESVARSLGPLCDRFVFVGGCATGLLITDSAASPVRATQDVDAIVEAASLASYHTLELQLEKSGFKRDLSPEAPMCRWLVSGCMLDIVPTDERILGFSNRWYAEAARTAESVRTLRGVTIRLIAAPVFLATKLEAFRDRGKGDFLSSHDLEDIIVLVDGRRELVDEVHASQSELRAYLSKEIGFLLQNTAFMEALPGHFLGDEASQGRVQMVLDRLRSIAGQ